MTTWPGIVYDYNGSNRKETMAHKAKNIYCLAL
jgi:hypothetical protein